jgi:hypothetical protein
LAQDPKLWLRWRSEFLLDGRLDMLLEWLFVAPYLIPDPVMGLIGYESDDICCHVAGDGSRLGQGEEGFLHHVIGKCFIRGATVGYSPGQGGVPPVEVLQGFAVTVSAPLDQDLVRKVLASWFDHGYYDYYYFRPCPLRKHCADSCSPT